MSTEDSTKRCSKCGAVKPVDEFRRRWGESFQPCKKCHCEAQRQYRKKHAEKIRLSQQRYREENQEALREKKAQYHRENAERIRAKARQWVEENPERHAANRKRWFEANPEKERESSAKWRRNNREKIRFYDHIRRAAERIGDVDASVVRQMYEDQDGLCAYCETPLFGEFHIEHMQPLSRGGAHCWENIAVTCPRCNHSKGALTVEEFFVNRPDIFRYRGSLATGGC